MKTVFAVVAPAVVALSAAFAAPVAADSAYETCVKMSGDFAVGCVKPVPPVTYAPPPDAYERMMEQLERDHDRQLWRQHIHEERERRAAGVLHENYLRSCATHSKRCRDELYGN